jgi:hypothetical protein
MSQRRDFLRLASSLALMPFAPKTGVCQGTAGAALTGESLYRDVVRWADIGEHRHRPDEGKSKTAAVPDATTFNVSVNEGQELRCSLGWLPGLREKSSTAIGCSPRQRGMYLAMRACSP